MPDVLIVQRRVDLVEEAEWARLGKKYSEQERERDQRFLAARQKMDPLCALAARRRVDLDVPFERGLRILEAQIALTAAEESHEDVAEVLTHLDERLEEKLTSRGVDLTDGLLQ